MLTTLIGTKVVHLGAKCVLSHRPSLMMAVAPDGQVGQAPNSHLEQKPITDHLRAQAFPVTIVQLGFEDSLCAVLHLHP